MPELSIALVSDIHGNLPALEAVAAEIDAAGVTRVANLGDIASGPLWPRETVAWLQARAAREPGRWSTIAGNHERQLLGADPARMSASDAFARHALDAAQCDWLAALPKALWLDDLLLCHGTPGDDLVYLMETVVPGFDDRDCLGVRAASADELRARLAQAAPGGIRTGLDATLVACGHTHAQRLMQAVDGPMVVNPGSVGLPGFDDLRPHAHLVQAGSPHARWALLRRRDTGPWQVELRATAYDWHAAAARAEAGGRGDWADVLATGFMGRTEDVPRRR